jgi:hypothetical protein
MNTRGAPDAEFAGYRISGQFFNSESTFKLLVKYEINKGIRCIKGFLFPYSIEER